jgi:CelD/BcsL family acetyltransferase involved in cellulose biosynthesis
VTASPLPLRVDVAASLDAIDALAPEWAALEARTPEATGFQSFAWCRRWIEAAGAASAARVVTVREAGRLVALWPIQIEIFLGARVARWIGEPMTQYGDILAEAGDGRERWRQAARAEFSRWRDVDLFAFTRLRADGVLAGLGAPMTPDVGSMSAPFVDLRTATDGRQRRRKSVERRSKRLAALGELRFAEIAEPRQREAVARSAIAMKLDWLRARGRFSSVLSEDRVADFIAGLARSGHLRVHGLWVGEQLAAVDIGFGGATYRSLISSYHLDFTQGSPGHVLTERLLDRLRLDGAARLDLLWPSDGYKLQLADGATPLGARIVAATLRGHVAAFALTRVRPQAKRIAVALSDLYKNRATPIRRLKRVGLFSGRARSADCDKVSV